MIRIIQYSGGAGSFAAAQSCIQQHGKENVVLLFSDTRMEDPDLYRFLTQTSAYLGVPVTIIADGRNPWQVFKDKRFLGNSRVDPCSRILKRELCKTWVEQRYTPADCELWFGIDWMEAHRIKNVENWWNPYTCKFPLVEDKAYDKNKLIASLAELGIDMPRLYRLGFPHNNCGGFCVKAGKAHFLHLLKTLPDVYFQHEIQETVLRSYLGKDVTILREQVNNEKRYLTLKELRERAEEIAKTEEGQLDWGGCGCFSDIPKEELK